MSARYALIELPEIKDARGCVTFAQGMQLPFTVRRMFMLYNITPGTWRGGHAHRAQHQLLVMAAGAALVRIDDGSGRSEVLLDRPNKALHVPPMLWVELSDFTYGAVCSVLASDVYDESDYVRDYAEFALLATANPPMAAS